MKCMTMDCHGNIVSSGSAPEQEQSLRRKKKRWLPEPKNKTEKKNISADFWLPDLTGEGASKTKGRYGPQVRRQQTGETSGRSEIALEKESFPPLTRGPLENISRAAPAGHHVLAWYLYIYIYCYISYSFRVPGWCIFALDAGVPTGQSTFFWTTWANSTWANWFKSSILCCVCCVCLLCVSAVCVGPRFGCSPGPLPSPPPDRPKFRSLFTLSRHNFHSFFSLGGPFVEFWWCF